MPGRSTSRSSAPGGSKATGAKRKAGSEKDKATSSSKSKAVARRRSTAAENDWPRPKQMAELKEGEPGTLTGRPLRLYADGIFDMFHFGHAKALQQAKCAYANVHLLVGCCNDKLTHKLKGRTVMRDEERYESLRHCRWVDSVVENAPWVVTADFIEKHDIDYVCHDALPYADASGQAGDCYAGLKAMGKFYETQRTDGISTSDLIVRIVSEYDTFVQRNLKRGVSAEEMKLPWTRAKRVRVGMAVDRARDNIVKAVDNIEKDIAKTVNEVKEEVVDVWKEWGRRVDKFQEAFGQVFERVVDAIDSGSDRGEGRKRKRQRRANSGGNSGGVGR